MKTAARPPLRRLAALDQMIRRGRFPNARTAALELEVHPRTVLRDLDFLRDSWGAPLEFSRKRNGYFYRDKDYALPLLKLTEGELVAFFLAERLMQQYRDSPFAKDLSTAFDKLTCVLPQEITIDLAHMSEAFSFRKHFATTGEVNRFRQLSRAVREGRQLELVYWTASRNETCKRTVDPYHLASVEGEFYLIAFCHLREDVRMFVPSRIRILKETGKRFERPADFRIGDYLDCAFTAVRGQGPPRQVRLRFAPTVAKYIEEKEWHPSQRLEQEAGGSLIMTFAVNHLLEVRRWVMAWGSDCEALEPAELRHEVAAEAARVAEFYR